MSKINTNLGLGRTGKTTSITPHRRTPWFATGLAVAALALAAATAPAQTVTIKSNPQRITVADVSSTVSIVTNLINISGVSSPVNLTLNGSILSNPNFSAVFSGLTSSSITLSNTLTIGATNLPEGEYTLDINASGGAANDGYLTVQSGRMWTGTTNVSTKWSSASSWVGGVPPGVADDVLFTQLGSQTNEIVSGALFANSEVDGNVTISSLRFSQTNTTSGGYHTLLIDPTFTLKITGPLGLRFLPDYTVQGLAKGTNAFTGIGGTLMVSNEIANIADLYDNGATAHGVDMASLGTFVADVNRIGIGDVTLYPNDQSISLANNYGTSGTFIKPQKLIPFWYLARTNYIKAVSVDANNYDNTTNRNYSLTLGKSDQQAGSSSVFEGLQFGITNVFLMDSICIAGFDNADIQVKFNNAFTASNPVAFFRNTDGVSRMSVFCLADASGTFTNAGGNTKCAPLDFASNNGRVDAKVDRFFMSRDRANATSGGTTAQSTMILAAGTFDANTAILGYQEQGNQVGSDYCTAQLIVSNTAIFKVNNTLALGYTAAARTDTSLPGDTYGFITVGPGGTLIASNITVGGVTYNSGLVGAVDTQGKTLNSIILTNGATLIVSNSIGTDTASSLPTSNASAIPGTLGQFNMYNSELVMNVDGNHSGAYVFVSAFNTVGAISNYLKIATMKNLTFPAQFPLIHVYNTAPQASAFTKVIMPSGYQGSLLVNATNANILDLNIIASTPKNLKWQGFVTTSPGNADWDTTTANWLDLNTGLQTNFDNGDFTTFDDSTSVTNINITSALTLIPNNVLVTNNTKNYTFSTSVGGSLNGGATIAKWGAGSLEIDAPTTLGVQLNQGSLLGASSGSVGGVTTAAGTKMTFAGNVGNGLACSGVATVSGGGSIGGISILSGGIVTNSGSFSGAFAVASGGTFYNSGSLPSIVASSVSSNGIMVNSGSIGADGTAGTITVDGTFEDWGISALYLDTLSIDPGAHFIPGGDGIGTTTVKSTHLTPQGGPGLVRLLTGSSTYFKVNLANSQPNTMLLSSRIVFGGSTGNKNQNGATLVLSNIGATPYSAGSLVLFGNDSGLGNDIGNAGLNTTNTYPVVQPTAPTNGLAWNVFSDLFAGSANPVNIHGGNIDIVGVATSPTTIVSALQAFNPLIYSSGTNSVTNNVVVAHLQWPSDHTGWRLQQLNTTLDVGVADTNWVTVFESVLTNDVTFTNSISSNTAVFYRLVYP